MTHLDPLGLLQEAGADGHQGVFRPLVEPVDGRAVDHGRELPRPHAQDGAHGGEAQDHLDAGHSGAAQGAGGAEADRARADRAEANHAAGQGARAARNAPRGLGSQSLGSTCWLWGRRPGLALRWVQGSAPPSWSGPGKGDRVGMGVQVDGGGG